MSDFEHENSFARQEEPQRGTDKDLPPNLFSKQLKEIETEAEFTELPHAQFTLQLESGLVKEEELASGGVEHTRYVFDETLEHAQAMAELITRKLAGKLSAEGETQLQTLQQEWSKPDGVLDTFRSLTRSEQYALPASRQRELMRALGQVSQLPDFADNLSDVGKLVYGEQQWASYEDIRMKIASKKGKYAEMHSTAHSNPALTTIYSDVLGRMLTADIHSLNPAFRDYLTSDLSPALTTIVRQMEADVRRGKLDKSVLDKFRVTSRRFVKDGEAALSFASNPPKTTQAREKLTENLIDQVKRLTA